MVEQNALDDDTPLEPEADVPELVEGNPLLPFAVKLWHHPEGGIYKVQAASGADAFRQVAQRLGVAACTLDLELMKGD